MTNLLVKMKDEDNVAIAVEEIKAGTKIYDDLTAMDDIPQAHNFGICS